VKEYLATTPKGAGAIPAMQDWASQSAAESLNRNFEEACRDGLRSNISQIRLYLEDERTVIVLLTHVLERITDEYTAFREVAGSMYAGALRGTLASTVQLGERLRDSCGLRVGQKS
jgi:hypothetical protein